MILFFAYFPINQVILFVVINMRKIELIKTKLYFILSVLLLTTVCIIVYTSMRSSKQPDRFADDSMPAQIAQAEEDEDEGLQPVNQTQYQAKVQQQPADIDEQSEALTTPEETSYRVGVKDGYLQVYLAQTDTIYMETLISYALLPERVRTQIDEGKYFESEEALLEFLENYSS